MGGAARLHRQEDQDQRGLLRQSLDRMLQQNWLKSAQRDTAPVWDCLVQLGFFELDFAAPGFGLREILLIMTELGRVACPVPFLPAILANIALGKKSPARNGHRIAVSFGAFDGDSGADEVSFAGDRLNGRLRFVENLEDAEWFVVFNVERRALLIPTSDSGISVITASGLSGSPLSDVLIHDVGATGHPIAASTLHDLTRIGRLGFAARAFGAAKQGFDLVVDHTKSRHQFGQPIGKFQAVQHKLANNLILLDACELQLNSAADAFDERRGDAPVLVESAIAFCAQTLRHVALETQHVFGAIGLPKSMSAQGCFASSMAMSHGLEGPERRGINWRPFCSIR